MTATAIDVRREMRRRLVEAAPPLPDAVRAELRELLRQARESREST